MKRDKTQDPANDEYTMFGPDGPDVRTTLERREFLKLAGGGLVVFFAVGDGLARQEGGRAAPRRLPRRPQRLPQGRPGRPGDLLHRQDRDGPGHHHLAGHDAGRRARRPARRGGHGHGRHGPLSLRRGHVRLAQHEVLRAAHAAGRGRSARHPHPAAAVQLGAAEPAHPRSHRASAHPPARPPLPPRAPEARRTAPQAPPRSRSRSSPSASATSPSTSAPTSARPPLPPRAPQARRPASAGCSNYLKKNDIERYRAIVAKLGLRN